MKQPLINIRGNIEAAEAMGVKVADGKVSRDGATKMWKVAGKLLGEATNGEALRRDKITGVYHSEMRLQDMI